MFRVILSGGPSVDSPNLAWTWAGSASWRRLLPNKQGRDLWSGWETAPASLCGFLNEVHVTLRLQVYMYIHTIICKYMHFLPSGAKVKKPDLLFTFWSLRVMKLSSRIWEMWATSVAQWQRASYATKGFHAQMNDYFH